MALEDLLPLWTVREAAEHLKVSTGTIHNWKRAGLIDVRQLPGGGLRIPNCEIDRLLTPDP